jgi:hypothetical protein
MMIKNLIRYSAADGGAGAPAGGSAPQGGSDVQALQNALAAERATNAARLDTIERQRANDRITLGLRETMDQISFASPQAKQDAIDLFKARTSLELHGDTIIAKTATGSLSLEGAVAAWVKSPSAKTFIASNIQPGAGAISSSLPLDGMGPKAYKDMTREEQEAVVERGITAPICPGGPVITYKRAPDPMKARRMELLGRVGYKPPLGGKQA